MPKFESICIKLWNIMLQDLSQLMRVSSGIQLQTNLDKLQDVYWVVHRQKPQGTFIKLMTTSWGEAATTPFHDMSSDK